ncbi:MAG: hypothetical protein R2731_16870 [Nocardioides sp.]
MGTAISVASLVALPASTLVGGLVDRYGAKQVLLAGNALQALGYAAAQVTQSLLGVVVWTVVVTVGRTAFKSYGTLVAAIAAPGGARRGSSSWGRCATWARWAGSRASPSASGRRRRSTPSWP